MNNNKWITDRPPTLQDADRFGSVWVTEFDGSVLTAHFDKVPEGTPWMPTNRPEPYEKPKSCNAQWSEGHMCWCIKYDKVTRCQIVYQWALTKKDEHREAAERIAAIYEEVM